MTMEQLAKARQVKEAYATDLLTKRNVVGVGLGHKVRGGRDTGELSLVVSVTRKEPVTALAPDDRVPKALDDMTTDVVETGLLRAFPNSTEELGPQDRWRPVVPPGVSVGHYMITAGTFGCLVQRGEELFILSNNHVLANSNECSDWDPVLQPGPADGGGPEDRIARLAQYVPLVFESEPSECEVADRVVELLNAISSALGSHHRLEAVKIGSDANRVDAALARPLSPNQVTNKILGIGVPVGIGAASLGSRVQKSGRTTGHTEGTITQVDATLRIDYYGAKALFTGQLVAGPMSLGGDSGSAILDMDRRVVGLLFAGSQGATILNPIDEVLATFGVELVL
ncbi:MAG: hypothetical protein U9R72_06915 [Chloroflexota bacterium]|nr:hypothetical protein [Chloroflexota bacterium]